MTTIAVREGPPTSASGLVTGSSPASQERSVTFLVLVAATTGEGPGKARMLWLDCQNAWEKGTMPRGAEPKQPLTDKEKLQLKQRGDNLRRRQGIGSGKYADFFFHYRRSYPFTRKTYPVLGGRVEPGNDEWDGVDPETRELADWLQDDQIALRNRRGEHRMTDDSQLAQPRASQRVKRSRSPEADEGPSIKQEAPAEQAAPVIAEESWDKSAGQRGESQRTLQRDLKVMMDALRQIPTPRRAALAIEGMLAKPEVQYALERFGTGSEFGLTRKELAAVSVLRNALLYRDSS